MAADVELLPMSSILLNWPHPTNHAAIREYARANVEHHTEALRAEVERLTRCLATANANHETFERRWYLEQARAERLAEALREAQPFIGWTGSYEELHAKIDALLRDHDQEVGNG